MTCAHVVQGYETEGIPVFWQGKALSAARVKHILPPPIDLALLLLNASDEEILPPSVLLDETFTPFDRLYIYGYPDDFPEGGSVTIQCEGDVREAKVTLIKAQAGQIRPGHSGSPALNFETGKVCGIVSDTRGRLTDLGGLLIPISTVFSHFPELKAQNQAAHLKDSLWHRLLSEQAQQSLTQPVFAAASFHFSTYRPETWTGREDAIAELTQALQNGNHLLLIHGLTGIGKTTLAERLAADFATPETYHRVAFDEEDRFQNFSRGALAILQTLGDDTAQQLPSKQLLLHLLKTLEQGSCWLQLDSVEYLLNQDDDGESHFGDASWLDFFYHFLTQPSNARIVLTSQALPPDLVNRCLRYDNLWYEISLTGLERNHWLDLFRNYGVASQTDEDAQHLHTIAEYFEGHPLILKMIVGDIGKRPFNGDVGKYWHEYYSQRQSQLAPKLRQSQEQRARTWINQTIQSLPDLPRQMLQHCAVFRRPIPEKFYRAMLQEIAPSDAHGAIMMLKDRNLVEEHDLQAGQFWLRQHNLIREVAYGNLRDDRSVWEVAERQAAQLWLYSYHPTPSVSNLEKVRGHLEAFYHFYEVGDWIQAEDVLFSPSNQSNKIELFRQLFIWNYYQELIPLYERLIDISHNAKNLELEGIASSNLGSIYLSIGQCAEAINYYQRNLLIAQDLKAFEAMGHSLGNLGLAYYYLEDLSKAIEFHKKNFDLTIQIGDKKGEMAALGNLGLAYQARGDYSEAVEIYRRCLDFYSKSGDFWYEAITLLNLGNALCKFRQYSESLQILQRAINVSKSIGDRESESHSLKNMAELYQVLGDINVARQYCQQALALATELGIPPKDECQKLMEELETGRG